MIVAHVDIPGARAGPPEDHAPLVIDSNAVVAEEVTLQSFESIPGGRGQVEQHMGIVEDV